MQNQFKSASFAYAMVSSLIDNGGIYEIANVLAMAFGTALYSVPDDKRCYVIAAMLAAIHSRAKEKGADAEMEKAKVAEQFYTVFAADMGIIGGDKK